MCYFLLYKLLIIDAATKKTGMVMRPLAVLEAAIHGFSEYGIWNNGSPCEMHSYVMTVTAWNPSAWSGMTWRIFLQSSPLLELFVDFLMMSMHVLLHLPVCFRIC
jgi:hypothetical protein